MSDNQLKPCPFCGNQNIQWTTSCVGHGENADVLYCNCGASMQDQYYSKQRLVQQWNKRVNEAL
jgi:Lar family restriction alleviation protein